jgi:phospholipid/cholesterol/gamma-HCH transport system substrate-binding protein
MSRGKEILVGLVLVAGGAFAVLGTLWLQDASFGRGTREVDVLIREVGQLMPGNAVKLRGVNIGQIGDIRVEPDGDAVRVKMNIREDVSLPESPAVLLSPESMFGDWQAEIVPRASYPQFDFMEPDEEDTLGGYALPDISRLTAAADRISENLGVLTDRVEQAFTEETANNIARAIDNIQDVSNRLRDLVEVQSAAFNDVATEVEAAAVELRTAAHAGHLAFQRAEELLGAPGTDSIFAHARATMSNLEDLSEELTTTTGDAKSLLTRADSTFARLDRLGARLEAGEGALGLLFQDTALVVQAEGVLSQLSALLEDLRENPQRYVRISIF